MGCSSLLPSRGEKKRNDAPLEEEDVACADVMIDEAGAAKESSSDIVRAGKRAAAGESIVVAMAASGSGAK